MGNFCFKIKSQTKSSSKSELSCKSKSQSKFQSYILGIPLKEEDIVYSNTNSADWCGRNKNNQIIKTKKCDNILQPCICYSIYKEKKVFKNLKTLIESDLFTINVIYKRYILTCFTLKSDYLILKNEFKKNNQQLNLIKNHCYDNIDTKKKIEISLRDVSIKLKDLKKQIAECRNKILEYRNKLC